MDKRWKIRMSKCRYHGVPTNAKNVCVTSGDYTTEKMVEKDKNMYQLFQTIIYIKIVLIVIVEVGKKLLNQD